MKTVFKSFKTSRKIGVKTSSKLTSSSRTKNADTIVLSDVDGTIIRGSLVLYHACFLDSKNIINTHGLSQQWLDDMKNENIISSLAETYRDSIAGKTLKDLQINGFMYKLFRTNDIFYTTLNRLIRLSNNNSDVMLISGSPSFLVDRLAQKFGFGSVGSHYTVDDNGRFTGECVGMFNSKAKEAFVQTLKLHGYNNVFAFGDTCSDKPLFDVATHSVLVEPNEYTLNKLQHSVQEVVYK